MPRPLKVFRTAIGFHDAYVAAPTMKAALAAWGAERNLFASGRAERVTDPKLTKAALADPGKVIKVLRGTAAEQYAALEASAPRRAPPPQTGGRPALQAPSPAQPRTTRSRRQGARRGTSASR